MDAANIFHQIRSFIGMIFVPIEHLIGTIYAPAVIIFKTIGILVLAFVIVRLGNRFIKNVIKREEKYNLIDSKRINTIGTILSSILKYTVYSIAIVTILTGILRIVDLSTILTAAGIGGVALGLGAQTLIKDIISGFFILMEHQYSVGDVITVEGFNGTVEDIELRVTRIRNFNGDLYIIPNGDIRKVTNLSKEYRAAIVDIPTSYEADMEQVMDALNTVCSEAKKKYSGVLLENPQILGITELNKDNSVVRIIAKTVPGESWSVERAIRKMTVEEYAKRGIEYSRKIITSDK